MNPIAPTGREAAHQVARLRIGIKGLLILVASCALIIWAGLSIRDHLEGYQPLRVIRYGNTSERRKAAIELSGRGHDDSDATMLAFIDALRDQDSGIRATVAGSLGLLVFELNQPRGGAIASDLSLRRIEVAARALATCLSDSDPGVRAAAATSLGLMVGSPIRGRLDPGPFAPLLDEFNTVRRQAARRIYKLSIVAFPARTDGVGPHGRVG